MDVNLIDLPFSATAQVLHGAPECHGRLVVRWRVNTAGECVLTVRCEYGCLPEIFAVSTPIVRG